MGLLVAGVGVPSECSVIVDDSSELSPLIDSAGSRTMVTVPAEWSSYFSVSHTVGTSTSKKPCFVEVGSAGFVNGFDGISITEIYSTSRSSILCRTVPWIYPQYNKEQADDATMSWIEVILRVEETIARGGSFVFLNSEPDQILFASAESSGI